MRVQHNIMAMNSYRNYSNNVKSLSGNLEKLSSGYKINRAGDDAAGLAISEKMRAQITGLEAAQKNVKDGISLVKTAEGAMQEIQDMLNRMDYLATQSANGTYQNEVDRENLQKEVTALKTEIDRIADSANFNGIKLLDGSLDKGTSSTTVTGLKDVTFNGRSDAVLQGPEAQAGKWVVDLSQLKFTSETSGETTVTLSIGTLNIGTVKVAGTTDESDKVTTDMKGLEFTAISTGEQKIGGVTVNIAYDEATGKLTVEMLKAPTTTANANAAGIPQLDDLTIKTTNSVGINFSDGKKADTSDAEMQFQVEQAPVVAGDQRQYAAASFSLTDDMLKDGMTIKIGNESYTFAIGADSKFKGGANVIDLTDVKDAKSLTTAEKQAAAMRLSEAAKNNSQFHVTVSKGSGTVFNLVEKEGSGLDYVGSQIVGKDGSATKLDDGKWKGIVQYGKAQVTTAAGGGLMLQIGDTADAFNQMNVVVGDMHVKALGIADVDIGNQEGAAAAIAKIKAAINQVSSVRGDLGAVQNRLDHTANNLSVMAENIQDAESTIRDTDVAEEMMSYVKNNILVQSAQAMLAQANQVPQGVLQLLG